MGEGDGRIQPADQLLIAVDLRAGIAEGVEDSGQGLGVTVPAGVDQPQRHSLQTGRRRVELRDPPHQRLGPGCFTVGVAMTIP